MGYARGIPRGPKHAIGAERGRDGVASDVDSG